MKKLLFIIIILTGFSCEPQSFVLTQKQSSNHKNYTSSGNSVPDEYSGLDTNTTTYTTVPALTKPAYLASATDPRFNTTITRITGDVGNAIPNVSPSENWRDITRHNYSTNQVWNADESLMFLNVNKTSAGSWGSSLFLNGETYAVIKKSNIPSHNEQRWHPTDPDVILILRDTEIVAWSYSTTIETQLMSFSGYTSTSLGYTGNWSDDGNVLAMSANRTSDGKDVVFGVNTDTDTKYPDIDASAWTDIDFVTTSPLGTYIVVNGNFGIGADRTRIYNLTTGILVGDWTDNGRPSHYDVAIDQSGNEVVVGGSRSGLDDGEILSIRMSDGTVTQLSNGGYNGHSSARAIERRGWVITAMSDSTSYPPYFEEIVAAKTDGSRIERIVNFRSSEWIYDAQTQACVSPSGGRVLFASDWGASNYPISTYVVDFRDKE